MSRVIKGSTVYVSQPKVIQIDELRELQEKYERSNNRSLQINQRKMDELEQIREESEEILRETESMIVDLLEKAKEEASDIITNAHEEADLIRADHMKKGYEEGIKKVLDEIEEERKTSLEKSRQLIEEAAKTKMKILRSSEADMLKLVMVIAKRVIGGELRTNPDVVINVINEALTYLDKTENITVHINAQEVLQVLDAMNTGQITDKNLKIIDFDVQANKKVSTGGCIIEGEEGQIDATIETRLDRMEKSIQGVIGDE